MPQSSPWAFPARRPGMEQQVQCGLCLTCSAGRAFSLWVYQLPGFPKRLSPVPSVHSGGSRVRLGFAPVLCRWGLCGVGLGRLPGSLSCLVPVSKAVPRLPTVTQVGFAAAGFLGFTGHVLSPQHQRPQWIHCCSSFCMSSSCSTAWVPTLQALTGESANPGLQHVLGRGESAPDLQVQRESQMPFFFPIPLDSWLSSPQFSRSSSAQSVKGLHADVIDACPCSTRLFHVLHQFLGESWRPAFP